MTKMMLLAGAMVVAAPALSQTTPQAAQTVPAQPAAGQQAPVTPAQPASAATAADVATAVDATPVARPAANADQVASAVDSQFGTYDKNGDGKLSRAEFAEWMVTLKTASDPSTKAESAETKQWVNAAFAQADTDSSKALDKTEVTDFLQQGQS